MVEIMYSESPSAQPLFFTVFFAVYYHGCSAQPVDAMANVITVE